MGTMNTEFSQLCGFSLVKDVDSSTEAGGKHTTSQGTPPDHI